MPYTKIAIIVDEFVDPFNLEQVMWALTTRVRPDKDVFKVPHAPGMPLDPSSERSEDGSKGMPGACGTLNTSLSGLTLVVNAHITCSKLNGSTNSSTIMAIFV